MHKSTIKNIKEMKYNTTFCSYGSLYQIKSAMKNFCSGSHYAYENWPIDKNYICISSFAESRLHQRELSPEQDGLPCLNADKRIPVKLQNGVLFILSFYLRQLMLSKCRKFASCTTRLLNVACAWFFSLLLCVSLRALCTRTYNTLHMYLIKCIIFCLLTFFFISCRCQYTVIQLYSLLTVDIILFLYRLPVPFSPNLRWVLAVHHINVQPSHLHSLCIHVCCLWVWCVFGFFILVFMIYLLF